MTIPVWTRLTNLTLNFDQSVHCTSELNEYCSKMWSFIINRPVRLLGKLPFERSLILIEEIYTSAIVRLRSKLNLFYSFMAQGPKIGGKISRISMMFGNGPTKHVHDLWPWPLTPLITCMWLCRVPYCVKRLPQTEHWWGLSPVCIL